MKFLKPKPLALALVLYTASLLAQPAPPNSANRTPLPGLVILAAAGAAFGARKTSVYMRKKKEE